MTQRLGVKAKFRFLAHFQLEFVIHRMQLHLFLAQPFTFSNKMFVFQFFCCTRKNAPDLRFYFMCTTPATS